MAQVEGRLPDATPRICTAAAENSSRGSTAPTGASRQKKGLPTDRYKRLEAQVQELKKQQLLRRAGKHNVETVGENGEVKVKVVHMDRIPPVPLKRVLAPVVVPVRLSVDEGYVERKFPKAAKQRHHLKKTGEEIDRLHELVIAETKVVNRLNADIASAEGRRDALRNEVANLEFQDNIEERRQQRGSTIEESKARLADMEEQMKEVSRYAKTLDRMLARISDERTVFQRTMEEYMKVLESQHEATQETEELARRMACVACVRAGLRAGGRACIRASPAAARECIRELSLCVASCLWWWGWWWFLRSSLPPSLLHLCCCCCCKMLPQVVAVTATGQQRIRFNFQRTHCKTITQNHTTTIIIIIVIIAIIIKIGYLHIDWTL